MHLFSNKLPFNPIGRTLALLKTTPNNAQWHYITLDASYFIYIFAVQGMCNLSVVKCWVKKLVQQNVMNNVALIFRHHDGLCPELQ